jgi:hypothetical protein
VEEKCRANISAEIDYTFLILLLIFAFLTSSAKAAQRLPKNIPWRATAIFLDEFDTEEKYSIPVKRLLSS